MALTFVTPRVMSIILRSCGPFLREVKALTFPKLQAVGLEERTFSRERTWPFARQIHAWLKEQDEPTAYIKINEEFRSPAMKQALELSLIHI